MLRGILLATLLPFIIQLLLLLSNVGIGIDTNFSDQNATSSDASSNPIPNSVPIKNDEEIFGDGPFGKATTMENAENVGTKEEYQPISVFGDEPFGKATTSENAVNNDGTKAEDRQINVSEDGHSGKATTMENAENVGTKGEHLSTTDSNNEMEEMKKEIAGLKEELAEKILQIDVMKQFIEEWAKVDGNCMFRGFAAQRILHKHYSEFEKLDKEIAELKEKLLEKDLENVGLKKVIEEWEAEAAENEGNRTIELSEIEIIEWNNNKWNQTVYGPNLTISMDGLEAKHSGPNYKWNSVRAIFPIPSFSSLVNNKPKIGYFEIQILSKTSEFGQYQGLIIIGFCDDKFPLEGLASRLLRTQRFGAAGALSLLAPDRVSSAKWRVRKTLINTEGLPIGWENSFGIFEKKEMIINKSKIEIKKVPFGDFKNGDVIGIGIANKQQNSSSLECFVTYNGKWIGKVALPQKFANLQLFPAVTLFDEGNSIRANFDKAKWIFNEFERVF